MLLLMSLIITKLYMQDSNTIKQVLQQESSETKPNQKDKKEQNIPMLLLAVFLVLLFTVLVGYIAYTFGKSAGKREGAKTTTETTTEIDTTSTKNGTNKTSTNETTTTQDSTDINKYLDYTSNNFKIKFSYPAEWGNVNERLLEAEGTEQKEVIVTFSNNPYLRMEGVTSDFDPGSIGDVCPILAYFKGWDKSNGTVCDQYGKEFTYNSTGPYYFGCLEGNLGTGSISYYYGPTNHCASYTGFLKIIDINTSTEDYPGVKLVLQITNSRAKDLAGTGKESSNVNDERLINEYKENYLEIWEAIRDDIKGTKTDRDYTTKKQLEEFDAFVETIQFVD